MGRPASVADADGNVRHGARQFVFQYLQFTHCFDYFDNVSLRESNPG